MSNCKEQNLNKDPDLTFTYKNVDSELSVFKISDTNSGIYFPFIIEGQQDAKIAVDLTELVSYYDVTQVIELLIKSLPLIRKYNQRVVIVLCVKHFERYTGKNISMESL